MNNEATQIQSTILTRPAFSADCARPVVRKRLGGDFFKLIPVVVDSVLVFFSFALAQQIEQAVFIYRAPEPFPWARATLTAFVLAISMYLNEMYSFWQHRRTAELLTSLARSHGLTLIAMAAVILVIPSLQAPWFVAFAAQFTLLFVWRTVLERKLIQNFGRERLMIIGSGERARRIREALTCRGQVIFELVGVTVDSGVDDRSNSCRRVGSTQDILRHVEREQIDHIIVAQDNPRNTFPADALLQLKNNGIAISEGEYFYERLMGKILTDYVRPSVLIFAASPMRHTLQIWAKKIIDFVVALSLLALTLPITLLTAILIKLTSRGPIFYTQERVGFGGRPFTIYKFRSMRTDAEKDGVRWASANDDRVTLIGKFIRQTRIDELPQLINVLKGNMSMVGPRPERPVFVNKLRQEIPFYDMRHTMRPGLSGWAQVRYRYGSSIEDSHEKLRYDLYYIKNYSLAMDLTILLETTKVVIFKMGAR